MRTHKTDRVPYVIVDSIVNATLKLHKHRFEV